MNPTFDQQLSALAYLFWAAKILIDAGHTKKARKLIEGIPEDMYQYAVTCSRNNGTDPKRRLFHYVLTALDPNPTGNRKVDLEKQFVYLMAFNAERVCG